MKGVGELTPSTYSVRYFNKTYTRGSGCELSVTGVKDHTGDGGYSLCVSEMTRNQQSGYDTFRLDLASWIAQIGRAGKYTLSYWVLGVKSPSDTISEGNRLLKTALRGASGIETEAEKEYSFLSWSTSKQTIRSVDHASATYEPDVWKNATYTFTVTEEDLASAQAGKTLDLTIDRPSGNWWTISTMYIDDISLTYLGMAADKEIVPKYSTRNIATEFVLMGDNVSSFDEEEVDITFTNATTNTVLTMPGFWDGDSKFVVRVSLPETGKWNYVISSDFDRWDGVTGAVYCTEYMGDLDIYKHGFITESGKYFTYADGTPFFYLGDTHWSLGSEAAAGEVEFVGYVEDETMPSGYRYTGDENASVKVDLLSTMTQMRAKQGYTVIQTEPIGTSYDLRDGITQSDINGFRAFDTGFKKIADAGLVHANAEFFFPSTMEKMILAMDGLDYDTPVAFLKCAAHDAGGAGRALKSDQAAFTQLTESEFNTYIANATPVEGKIGMYRDNTNATIIYYKLYDYTDEFYEYLEKLSRYWVARYSAYPVMWTLGQEVDNDYYANKIQTTKDTYLPQNSTWNYLNSPYILVAEFLSKYDAYSHPLSAHQEGQTDCLGNNNAYYTYANAAIGTHFADRTLLASLPGTVYNSSNQVSVFENVTGHTWYAAQNSAQIKIAESGLPETTLKVVKDYYYNTAKPVVDYEAKYCYLWTKNYGMRYRGWVAFLNGNAGYAYGAGDLWNYGGTYDLTGHTLDQDGDQRFDKIWSIEKCFANYVDGLNFNSGTQVTYIRRFFNEAGIDFTTLVPSFNDENLFTASASDVKWTMASSGTTRVYYFYGTSETSATYAPDVALTAAANALPDEFFGNYKTEKYSMETSLTGDDKTRIGVMRLGGYDMPTENATQSAETALETGIATQLTPNATFAYRWFNPVTGEWYGSEGILSSNGLGQCGLPYKPTGTDWVLYVRQV